MSRFKSASTGLECKFFLANDDQWYMGLEDDSMRPDDDDEEGWESWSNSHDTEWDYYGPFNSEMEAQKFLRQNFANPGGWYTDKSGRRKPPLKPINPHGRRLWAQRNIMSLRAATIRLAATTSDPELKRGLLQTLTATGKQAHAGREIMDSLLDRTAFVKVYRSIDKQDEQSSELLREVYSKLADALKISDNEYNALGRIRQVVASGDRWSIGFQRNNIFKAADLMGMKLPSGMFASTQGKQARYPDEDWGDDNPSAPETLWGPAQFGYKVDSGVWYYETAGHGGLMVENTAARRLLTPAALKAAGYRWQGKWWFEEDEAVLVPFYEHPEWATKAGAALKPEDWGEMAVRSAWPKYFDLLGS